jgi:hypothetical protein
VFLGSAAELCLERRPVTLRLQHVRTGTHADYLAGPVSVRDVPSHMQNCQRSQLCGVQFALRKKASGLCRFWLIFQADPWKINTKATWAVLGLNIWTAGS